jgi:hypothetical protein
MDTKNPFRLEGARKGQLIIPVFIGDPRGPDFP